MTAAQRAAAIARFLDQLTDEEILALQSEVSRRAHHVRLKDPEHRRRWEAGVQLDRERKLAGKSTARSLGTG